ncbi:MAG: hypothetical protein CFE46_13515 [Burkholderiales bacterium PBB6]|nr:MAG: hypothetical protein CFE46_13515 [Burkholderiales bacterium PBB6]
MKTALIVLSLVAACGTALAQSTPAGLWKTIDDETKQEKSLVRITEAGGVYSGKIEKLSDPTKANAVCEKCTDERKDKPVVGMVILRNIREDKDDKGVFEGGDILDPNNGKVYKARLKPIDGGKKLEMRGYIGAPMFGRTQTWIRVE